MDFAWKNRHAQKRVDLNKPKSIDNPFLASSKMISRKGTHDDVWFVHFTSKKRLKSISKNGLKPSLAVNGFGVYAYRIGSSYDCATTEFDDDCHVAIWFKTDMSPSRGGQVGNGEVVWRHIVKFTKVSITSPSEAYRILEETGFHGSHGRSSIYYYDEDIREDRHVYTGCVDDFGNKISFDNSREFIALHHEDRYMLWYY